MAVQLEQTDALLNKYIDTLSRSEEFTRLILDEQWMGADAVRATLSTIILDVSHRRGSGIILG